MEMVTEEPLYTLEQARYLLARQDCLDLGHDLYLHITWVGYRTWVCQRGCGVIVEFRYPDYPDEDEGGTT
jgi:hypothetical protein